MHVYTNIMLATQTPRATFTITPGKEPSKYL